MIAKIHEFKSRVQGRLNEKGAVAFEYVLLIGGVSAVIVGLIVGVAPGLMGTVIDGATCAINGIPGFGTPCP